MTSHLLQRGAVKIVTPLVAGLFLATMANAACLPPESRLPQDRIQSFLGNPAALLGSNPTGGGGLENMIRALVASDNTTLQPVIQLLGSASPQQRAAIGAGLAAAAQTCLGSDQAFAVEIQAALAATGDRVAMTAFVSAGGQETATAATGAGAPGATAFVSGVAQTPGNSNTGGTATALGGATGGGNFLVFTGGAGPGGGASNPVSP